MAGLTSIIPTQYKPQTVKKMRDDDGRPMTDKEVRAELQRHLSLGHTTLTIYDQDEDTIFTLADAPHMILKSTITTVTK